MDLTFSKVAQKDLNDLPSEIRQRIITKLKWYASQDRPLIFAKRLTTPFSGYFRFRIGEFRAIVLPNGRVLRIMRVLKRSEAY